MRQSMQDMHRTRAQASFSRFLILALREVSSAVDETLDVASRRSALLPASILTCCDPTAGVSLLLYEIIDASRGMGGFVLLEMHGPEPPRLYC